MGSSVSCTYRAVQGRVTAVVLVQSLLFLGVCGSAAGGEDVLSTHARGLSWTQATCPSANTICKMLLLGEIPAPLPLRSLSCQLQLLYRFSFLSTLLQLREKLPPLTLPPTSPFPSGSDAILPPITMFADPVMPIENKQINESVEQQRRCSGRKSNWGR